jgi:hypothetical protein
MELIGRRLKQPSRARGVNGGDGLVGPAPRRGRLYMTDQHQINTIIAIAICDCRKDNPDNKIDLEEAKHMAKCILTALTDAGFRVVIPSS